MKNQTKRWLTFGLTLLFLMGGALVANAAPRVFQADRNTDSVVKFADLELTVPAGANEEQMTVDFNEGLDLSGYEKPSGVKLISKPYKFGPQGMKFNKDKPLRAIFRLNNIALPIGRRLDEVKLFYINQEAKKLELVEEQQINPETMLLEAKLKHFSDYTLAVSSVEPAWNGDGINPFYDYVHNGEEHVSLYQPRLSILSPVISLPGRGGMDLKLARAYSSRYLIFTNPFIISRYWCWAFTYYDFANHELHFPDGTSYPITVYNLRETAGFYDYSVTRDIGETVFTVKHCKSDFDGIHTWVKQIIFKDGTRLDIPSDTYQTFTDIHGNQIKYNIQNIRFDIPGTYDSKYFRLLSSIEDSVGRIFQFNYDLDEDQLPCLVSVIQQPYNKTILRRRVNGYQEIFTDAAQRDTIYNGAASPSGQINEIVYANGLRSQYSYEYSLYDPTTVKSHYLNNNLKETYFIPMNNYIHDYKKLTVTDEVRQKVYTLSSYPLALGLTVNETTNNLSGDTPYQSVDRTYTAWPHRPATIATKYLINNNAWTNPAVTQYTYDNWGNITKIIDPMGTITYMAYANTDNNGSSLNLSQINSAYQDACFTYGPSDRHDLLLTKATLITDPSHPNNPPQLNQTHYRYDDFGNLRGERVVFPRNPPWFESYYYYDSYGNLTIKCDPNNNVIEYKYNIGIAGVNDGSFLTEVYSYKWGSSTSTLIATYNKYNDYNITHGKPSTITDANGNIINYIYDATGRVVRERLFNPGTTGLLSSDKSVVTRQLFYDDVNSQVWIFYGNDGNWQVGQITYHPVFGKPARIQRKKTNINNYYPDPPPQMLWVNVREEPPTSWTTIKKIIYDRDGRISSESDNLGHTTSYQYDPLDRVIKTTYPDGTFATANWSGLNVTKYDENNNQRHEEYDALHRLTMVSEMPHLTLYCYDSANHLVETVDHPNDWPTSTYYTYDNLGRLTKIDFQKDGASPLQPEIYTYDDAGNLKTKVNAKGTKTFNYEFMNGYRIKQVIEADGRTVNYTYDNNSNLLTQSWQYGSYINSYSYTNYDAHNKAHNITAQLDGNSFTFGYDYDLFGRMTSISYPNRSNAVTYQYDDLDRLQAIPGFVNSCTYDDDSKLTGMNYANGINNTWIYYSNNDRLSDISCGSFLNLHYNYDAVGNITQINNDYYNYDNLNRLIWSGDKPYSQMASATGTQWLYSSSGNIGQIQKRSAGVVLDSQILGYDRANRLWSKGNISYTNDSAGARTAKTVGGDTWYYSYDGELRLNQVVKNGQVLEENAYDGSGMRIKKVSGGQTTYYIYGGNNPIMEYTPSGNKYTYYIFAGNSLVAEEKDGVKKFYHKDHLGSTRVVTDASGNTVATYKFAPYGSVDSHTGADMKYGFTGKEGTADTGLIYFGARFYDPEVGRFTTMDPAMDGLNYYTYANNNPIKNIDPNGLWVQNDMGNWVAQRGDTLWGLAQVVYNDGSKCKYGKLSYSGDPTTLQVGTVIADPVGSTLQSNGAWVESNRNLIGFAQWVEKVSPHQEWDFKNDPNWNNSTYNWNGLTLSSEDLGNLNYGYTGAALGLSEGTVMAGNAGANALFGSIKTPVIGPGLGDSLHDTFYSNLGYQYYVTGSFNEALRNAYSYVYDGM
jgi:RHS repeat-associated protein